jgi:hypothetical protein
MSRLTIIPRVVWRPARRRGPVTRRPRSSIVELFVHWPGAIGKLVPAAGFTREQERAIMRKLQTDHMQGNGWSDIGYNHVLFPNPIGLPRVYTARGAQYVPASQLGHNSGTISIMVYMGTDDVLLDSTKARLRSYVRWVDRYAGRRVWVRRHGAVVSTECPGPALRRWVAKERHR